MQKSKLLSKEKTPASVMNALKSGSFYASQGPEFHKLGFENNVFSVECSPCEKIIVMSNGSFGSCGNMSGFEATTPKERNDFFCNRNPASNKPDLPSLPNRQRRQIRLELPYKT